MGRLAWLTLLAAVVGVTTACGRVGFELLGDGEGGRDGAVDTTTAPDAAAATGATVSATRFGGAGNDEAYDIVVAGDGTVLATGTFEGSITFGATTLTGAGLEDVFVASFDPDGTPRWARGFGATGTDRGQAIAVDAAGRSYVCGLFSGSVDFGGQVRAAAGMWDVFVAAYEVSGALRWVRTAGSVGADFAYDLAIDPGGNVLVTGYYEGDVDFGAGTLPSLGTRDAFVAKYDASGVLAWARGFGSAGSDAGQGVASTATGDVIVGGTLGGPTDFGAGAIGAAGGSFVLELATGGTTTRARALTAVVVWDLDVDRRDGKIVTAARVLPGTDLGAGVLPTPMGTSDGLVATFAADHAPSWHQAFGGTLADLTLGITVDGAGNTYAIGLGGPSIDFGAGTIPGAGEQDINVTSHDPLGGLRWARMFGGPNQDRGYGIAVAPSGAVYVSGRFSGTADFGTGPLTSAGGNDMFLVQLD